MEQNLPPDGKLETVPPCALGRSLSSKSPGPAIHPNDPHCNAVTALIAPDNSLNDHPVACGLFPPSRRLSSEGGKRV